MLDGIVAARLCLLLMVVVMGGTAALSITARGRDLLGTIGRAIPRQISAFLIAAFGAGLCGLMTTIAVDCFYARPPFVNLKGVVALLLFGVVIGLPAWVPVIFVRSLPVFLLAWLPLWIARHRIPGFWRWQIAPWTGAILSYASWLIVSVFYPLFPDGYMHRDLVKAAHVSAVANGVFMFAAGCDWPFLKRRPKRQSPPRWSPPQAEGAKTDIIS